jgi:hypothetical protein
VRAEKSPPSSSVIAQICEIDTQYCTNDVRAAESALLQYLQKLSAQEVNHVKGIDFDMAKAMTHERLFLIYRKTGETNKAQAQFEESMEYLRRFSRRNGLPAPTNTPDAFAEALERSERGMDVRWKKQ